MIEADVKPFVNFIVQLKVLVADLLGSQTFLQLLRLRGRSVLVRSAHVQRPVVACISRRHHQTTSKVQISKNTLFTQFVGQSVCLLGTTLRLSFCLLSADKTLEITLAFVSKESA